MSDYFVSLDSVAKERYRQRLDLLGLDEKSDPYRNAEDLVDDMTLWPPVEYGHIFCCFIERPGFYTQQQLMQWKSLEAYNYFVSGHVRSVMVRIVTPTCCVLKALVNPSQSSPDKAHEAWVAVKSDGQIMTAHCKCMAGLGEGCSHVAAIMFKVESGVKNGYTSITSGTCRWNQVFTKKHEPSQIVDIDFTRLKRPLSCDMKESKSMSCKKQKAISPPTFAEKKAFIETLQHLEPKASILTATMLQPPTSKKANLPQNLPRTIFSCFDPKYRSLSESELKAECEKIFKEMKVTKEEAEYLVASTTLQSESLLWYEQRKGRITASHFGSVFNTRINPPSESLINTILQEEPFPSTAAIRWGREKEAVARKEYINAVKDDHIDFSVELTGLHINPSCPHLGASPNGIVSCFCCGDGLLEIKCPYSKREVDVRDIADQSFYLKQTQDGLKLSRSHKYYFQIQGQLAICDYPYCDFVCWSLLGMHIERIMYDATSFDQIKPKLDHYFISLILPRIMRGKEGSDNENTPNVYCLCRKGEHDRMIACDNQNCKYNGFILSV